MLAKAAERHVYDKIIEAEIHDYFDRSNEIFDLIVAADVLVYIGDLSAFITGAARHLEDGGILAFSIESTDAADFTLLPSGRFAHHLRYITQVAAGLFSLESVTETQLRRDATHPAMGQLVVLKKLPAQ